VPSFLGFEKGKQLQLQPVALLSQPKSLGGRLLFNVANRRYLFSGEMQEKESGWSRFLAADDDRKETDPNMYNLRKAVKITLGVAGGLLGVYLANKKLLDVDFLTEGGFERAVNLVRLVFSAGTGIVSLSKEISGAAVLLAIEVVSAFAGAAIPTILLSQHVEKKK
jgi:hypothetical protein